MFAVAVASLARRRGGANTLCAGAELHLLVATWKCSSNYQVLPPSWQAGHKQRHKLVFCGALDTLVCRQSHGTCAAMFPSVFRFLFSSPSLSLSLGLPLCWRVLLGPRGVCAIFLRPNVAGIAATLSTNLRDYQSQQTKGNLSPLDD